MAIFASGVEGGAAVSGQTDGITLSQAGDYALLLVSNSSPPAGPDASAIITFSGPATNASISVQKAYSAGTGFTTLSGVTDANGNLVGDPYQVPATDVDLNANNIAGLYAIKVVLNNTPNASLLVQGQSSPGSIAGTEASILAQSVENNALLRAVVLGLSFQTDTDLLSAVGGSW